MIRASSRLLSKLPPTRVVSTASRLLATTAFNPALGHGPFSEFSVVYTDRALNSMSPPFVETMQSISTTLKETYNADKCVMLPGSGSYAMESVARQFLHPVCPAHPKQGKPIVLRNGWFSYRWTEIFAQMGINEDQHTVLLADQVQAAGECELSYKPHDVDAVVAEILSGKPPIVFCPHVETSTGVLLTDDYVRKVGAACKSVGAVFVLDGIASGTIWIDMKDLNVDVFITAPQKGWSGPAAVGIAMLSDFAHKKMIDGPPSSSFALDLRKWDAIMGMYEGGGFGYHTTMPTDAIRAFREIADDQKKIGLDVLKKAQQEMGDKARVMLESKGLKSVASAGAQAPGVLVYYSPAGISNAEMVGRFKEKGMQIAMGVPWRIGEPDGLLTFRIGLFGIDKLKNVDQTVKTLEEGIDYVMSGK